MQRIIGASYLSLGQYELAERNLSAALAAHREIYGEENPETLKSMVLMAQLWMNRGDHAEAVKFYEARLSIIRHEKQKGAISADFLMTALNDLAIIKRGRGNPREAELLLREALIVSSEASVEAKTGVDVLEGVLALCLADQGKFDEAIEIVRAKIANIRRQPNSFSQGLAANLTGLGSFLTETGNYEEAGENLREAEIIYRRLFDPSFLPLGDNLRLQAQLFYLQGKYPEAAAKIDETLKIYRKNTNAKYVNFATALTIQGLILSRTDRRAEAENIIREAVRIRADNLPRGHFLHALTIGTLGECLLAQKRYDEAAPLLAESYETLRNSQGEENPRTVLARTRLQKLSEARKEVKSER